MHATERRVIGIDVDGVLADFVKGFNRLLVEVTGRDLLGKHYVPTVWDWPTAAGYTPEEIAATTEEVRYTKAFWLCLDPYRDVGNAVQRLLTSGHDVYFITNRYGRTAKAQTEVWLDAQTYGHRTPPTVLVTPYKGLACQALGVTHYLDDNEDNCLEATVAGARTFICDRPCNRSFSHRDVERTGLQGFLEVVCG